MKTIDSALHHLFAAHPELCGFSVGQLQGELCLADVETDPRRARSDELARDIATALAELIDEEPEAAELLRGRTFARTLH